MNLVKQMFMTRPHACTRIFGVGHYDDSVDACPYEVKHVRFPSVLEPTAQVHDCILM
jgi:hypothetical protein